MANNVPTHRDWRSYFSSLTSSEVGNQNISMFVALNDVGTKEGNEILNNAVADPDFSFLYANSNTSVQVVHSLKLVGGTPLRPTKRLMALLGLGPKGTEVELDIEHFLEKKEFSCPPWLELKDCDNFSSIIDRTKTRNGGTGYIATECVGLLHLPPFARDAIMQSGATDINTVFSLLRDSALEFDRAHENIEGFNDKAMGYVEDASFWLCGAVSGEITSPIRILPDDGELLAFSIERHAKYILPPVAASVPNQPPGMPANGTLEASVFTQLAHVMAQSAEEAKQSNKLRAENLEFMKKKEEDKSNTLKDLHPSALNMIEMASSEDCEFSGELSKSCKAFYNKKSNALAEQELSIQLKSISGLEPTFGPGLIGALRSGQFTFSNPTHPSNFSAFNLWEKAPGIINPLPGSRQLSLSMSPADGSKSSKQVVQAPKSLEDLVPQVTLFRDAHVSFFGKKSASARGLSNLLTLLQDNRSTLRYLMASDELLASKLLFNVDLSTQRWLEQCRIANDRETDVDDSLMNFFPLVNQTLSQQLNVVLPSPFEMNEVPTENKGNDDDDGKRKRKRDSNSNGGGSGGGNDDKKKTPKNRIVKNENPDPDFALNQGENWKIFIQKRGQGNADRVKWDDNECLMCARYHIKQYCFEDCRNIDSHVSKDKIPAEKKSAFLTFMKQCRKEA